MNLFVRIALAMAFGLITFWPNYGLLWFMIAYFPIMPIATSLLALLWTVIFMLLLPLTRRQFRYGSTGLLAVIITLLFYKGQEIGWLNVFDTNFWLTWFVAATFFLIGWMLIATPIWRKMQGITAVDTGHDHDHPGD